MKVQQISTIDLNTTDLQSFHLACVKGKQIQQQRIVF
jgi:hypothetical protein